MNKPNPKVDFFFKTDQWQEELVWNRDLYLFKKLEQV